jgi:hypothetical protein
MRVKLCAYRREIAICHNADRLADIRAVARPVHVYVGLMTSLGCAGGEGEGPLLARFEPIAPQLRANESFRAQAV